jgi:very-short-patch-repair endonuclease
MLNYHKNNVSNLRSSEIFYIFANKKIIEMKQVKVDQTIIPHSRHNKNMLLEAKKFAKEMRDNPSYLEKRMASFLRDINVKYDNQWIFLILSETGNIERYYIVDFFLKHKKIAIEVDGKFHSKQI